MALWKKVILAMFLGILAGLLLKEQVIYLKPLGDIFIRLIKMVIVPLIFFAIVGGISSIQDSAILGRIGIKSAVAYILTTLFAVSIGIIIALVFEPGSGVVLNLTAIDPQIANKETGFLLFARMVLDIIPDNAIGAMAQGAMLPVVFFAVFTGVIVSHLKKEDAEKFTEFFRLCSQLFFKMIQLIVKLSPMAAFSLTAWVVGTQGVVVLEKLMKLILCSFVAFAVQYCVLGLMIYIWARLSPMPFYRKSFEYQSVAFSTSSSKAVLPMTIDIAQNRLGVSPVSASFVLPLGASINMDGMAIYLSLCALFFAQATGMVLGLGDYACIIFTSTLGSIGGAGIPSGSLVMLPMVLGSVGLPIEGMALIAGIDRIMDMMRTTMNITGDVAVTVCVDQSEKRLNTEMYYQS